jgi:amino acid transporter
VLSNFSISFTVISVLTGVTTLYNTGLAFGGPATMTLGWFLAGAFTMAVGLSMAEICSAFPTSGGLYYWSARLSGHRWAPFASWITGWYSYFDCPALYIPCSFYCFTILHKNEIFVCNHEK